MEPDRSGCVAPRIEGVVVEGARIARRLGYPTANLEPSNPALVPDDGVYAGWLRFADNGVPRTLPAVVSIGRRPTHFGSNGQRLVEAHLLDFHGQLYGVSVALDLCAYLRPQRTFASEASLRDEIARDVVAARVALSIR
jgi:FAD synthase